MHPPFALLAVGIATMLLIFLGVPRKRGDARRDAIAAAFFIALASILQLVFQPSSDWPQDPLLLGAGSGLVEVVVLSIGYAALLRALLGLFRRSSLGSR